MSNGNSFWKTLPGILTGLAAVISAVSAIVIALNQSEEGSDIKSKTLSELTPKIIEETVIVSAADGWRDSRIDIKKSVIYQITASGTWNAMVVDNKGRDTPDHGPDGIPNQPRDYQAQRVNLGALIAKFGNSEPFYVGGGISVEAPDSNTLYLGIQDKHQRLERGGLSDNRGTIKVKIKYQSTE